MLQSVAKHVGSSGSKFLTPFMHSFITLSLDVENAQSNSADQTNGVLELSRWRNGSITGSCENAKDTWATTLN